MQSHQKTYKRKTFSELQGWRSKTSKSEISSPINISAPYKVHSLAELHSAPRYPDFIAPPNYFPSISKLENRSNRKKGTSSLYQFETFPDKQHFHYTEKKLKRSKFSSISTKACENDLPLLWTPLQSIESKKESNFSKLMPEETISITHENDIEILQKEKLGNFVRTFSVKKGKDPKHMIERSATRLAEIKKITEGKEIRSKSMLNQKHEKISEGNSQISVLVNQDKLENAAEFENLTFQQTETAKLSLISKFNLNENPSELGKSEEQKLTKFIDQNLSETDKKDYKNFEVPDKRPKFQIIIHPDLSEFQTTKNHKNLKNIPLPANQKNELSLIKPNIADVDNRLIQKSKSKTHKSENFPQRTIHSSQEGFSNKSRSFVYTNLSNQQLSFPVLTQFPLEDESENESTQTIESFHISRNSLQKNPEVPLSTIIEEPLAKSETSKIKHRKKAKTFIKNNQLNENIIKKKLDFSKINEILSVPSNGDYLQPLSKSRSSSREVSLNEEKEQTILNNEEITEKRRQSVRPNIKNIKGRGSVRVQNLRRTSTEYLKGSNKKSKIEMQDIQRRNTMLLTDSEKTKFLELKPKKSVLRFINNFSIYMLGQLSVLLETYKGSLDSFQYQGEKKQSILMQQRKTIKRNMIKEVKTAFKFLRKSHSLMTPEVIIQSISKGLFSQGIKNELISIIRTNKRQESLNTLKSYMVQIIKKRLNRGKTIDEESSPSVNSEKSSEVSSCELDLLDPENFTNDYKKRSNSHLINSTYLGNLKQPIVTFSFENLDIDSEESLENVNYLENNIEIEEELAKIAAHSKSTNAFNFSTQFNHSYIDRHNPDDLNPDWNPKIEELADMENMRHLILKHKFLETLKNDTDFDFFPFERLLVLEADAKDPSSNHLEEIRRIRKLVRRKKYLKNKPTSFVSRRVKRTFSNLVKVPNH